MGIPCFPEEAESELEQPGGCSDCRQGPRFQALQRLRAGPVASVIGPMLGTLAAVKESHSKMQEQITALQKTVGEEHSASCRAHARAAIRGRWQQTLARRARCSRELSAHGKQGAGSQDSWVLFLALPDSLPGPELGYSGFCFLDSVCGHCPWGWAWFQRTCYYFSESTKIWREAKQFCLDYGAQLVIINTKEEQPGTLQTSTRNSRAYWLGLSDKKVENQWLWVDGSPLKLSFWSSGEPNDSGDEDCGTMTLDGRWNDINCYMTDYWICEKPWLC
uniref:C-type lectin domain-containing protein n=1 Tax=Chrysemys picta bellii TaxID=8478 RepID=A0A8C3HCI2_CHRPI